MRKIIYIYFILFCGCQILKTDIPNPKRYEDQIKNFIPPSNIDSNLKPVALFTGSSSIRRWNNLTNSFPSYHVVNTGFGGSTMKDLEYYLDQAILQYKPDIIFIYEGDNDIKLGMKEKQIMRSTRKIIERIRIELPESQIILISIKPSIDRWNLKQDYLRLNKRFFRLADKYDEVYYIDMWSEMLQKNGKPNSDIFIQDGIHLNNKGYEIWKSVIQEFLHGTDD